MITNIIDSLPTNGKYMSYGVESKTTLAIHHSLTEEGSAESFAKYHVGVYGWPGIGYHFVIEKDGTIKQCNKLGTKSYHVGNANKFSIGICLTGDFRIQQPTKKQEEALRWLVFYLQRKCPNLKYIKGHNDFPGYSVKECPCFDFRKVTGIKGDKLPPLPSYKRVLKLTHPTMMHGEDVRAVQMALNIRADGIYGDETKRAVRAFQESHNLAADGIVGPRTWSKLFPIQ